MWNALTASTVTASTVTVSTLKLSTAETFQSVAIPVTASLLKYTSPSCYSALHDFIVL